MFAEMVKQLHILNGAKIIFANDPHFDMICYAISNVSEMKLYWEL